MDEKLAIATRLKIGIRKRGKNGRSKVRPDCPYYKKKVERKKQ